MSRPSRRPEVTTERAAARRWAGTRSATRGIINWGVTVVTEERKEMAQKTENDEVMHSPSLSNLSMAQQGTVYWLVVEQRSNFRTIESR